MCFVLLSHIVCLCLPLLLVVNSVVMLLQRLQWCFPSRPLCSTAGAASLHVAVLPLQVLSDNLAKTFSDSWTPSGWLRSIRNFELVLRTHSLLRSVKVSLTHSLALQVTFCLSRSHAHIFFVVASYFPTCLASVPHLCETILRAQQKGTIFF